MSNEVNSSTENPIVTDNEFLEEIKRDLQITWTDTDTDEIIKKYIKEGVEVLQNDVDPSLTKIIDFNEDNEARGLLSTYIRYAWNKSEEFFIDNNLERILKLEVRYGKD